MSDKPESTIKQRTSTWPKLRKYCRFNLRFFLVAVTVICVCFAYQLRRAERQQKGVEFVIDSGGSVRYDYQIDMFGNFDLSAQSSVPKPLLDALGHDFFHTIVNVNLEKDTYSFPGVFSHGMKSLFSPFTSHFSKEEPIRDLCKAFPYLKRLTIDKRHASNKTLEYVGTLSRLKDLSVQHSKYISDEGVEHLRHTRSLQTVYLLGTSLITDNSLEALGKLPNLQRINVQSGNISDTGIGHLKDCKNLTKAYFMPPRQSSYSMDSDPLEFTDDALRTLGSLSNLEVIGISSSRFTDDGVDHLVKLEQLHTLILRGSEEKQNDIDDQGLFLLIDNKLLTQVDVSNSKVTALGAKEFMAKFPTCWITANFR